MSVPIVAAMAGGAVVLALPILVAAQALVAGASAANAADAAALAAADAQFGAVAAESADACEFAAVVAEANGAAIVECSLGPATAEARVTVRARAGVLWATRQARAGPPQ
ncbi:helicase [Leucobacter aridicollis]|uniref:Ketopantoate hydroxymethyltransferase n=1 Tax=Leucobacter aridicollis TaxID=283878 RepID=A0A852R9E4_9MICO|nr:helicase [Leucobacter aridicollis]MBL3683283.1 helicase [Leucobacter aridicollis]NYD25520.1 ketopantoate hydroxymethyltransferase [Leucobacter aridicollis]